MSKESSASGREIMTLAVAAARWPHWSIGDHTCTNGLRCPGKHQHERHPAWSSTPIVSVVGGPAIYLARYRYVTGRAMRTTVRELFLCEPCGQKWAAKHGLTIETEIPAGAA